MRRVLIALLVPLAVGCVRTPHQGPDAPKPVAGSNTSAAKSAAPAVAAPEATAELPELIPVETADPAELLRLALTEQRFLDARGLLEQPEFQRMPARALIVGYVELQLADYDAAASRLRAAKEEWPRLTKLIEPFLRRAQLRSSDYKQHLHEVERSRDPDELLLVAGKLLEEGDAREALKLVQRAAAFTGGSKRVQAEVRALRAQVYLALDQRYGALMDWRWLAVDAPLQPAAAGADELIERHFPETPLKPEQRYLRATRFAEAGRVPETDRELERVVTAPYYRVRPGDALHLQGWARYRARDYEAAAEWLLDAAQNGSYQALRDQYYAARSLSRAGRVYEAIALFEKVAMSTPKGPITRGARFHVGSEWLVLGEWQKAVDAHSSFLNNYTNSEHTEAAQRERAVAWFALGEYQRAAFWFRKLRSQAPDGSDANLYQLLEAVAQEHLGHPDIAVQLLRDLALNSPLSFAGHQSRARLSAIGEQLPPLFNEQAEAALPIALPPAVRALEDVGLSEFSEDVLQTLEPDWLQPLNAQRTQAQCQGYGDIEAGRRRFLIGISQATRSGFFSRPASYDPWLWRCVYPTPYTSTVKRAAQRWNVSPALVYAVMRQESGFHSSIESPAKARGLMQIIPPTAERIALELGEHVFDGLLDTPAHNVRYGTFYLRKLLNAFDDHPAAAVAAYNAGPQAAMRWRHATSALPVELFVARIPFSETRGYVQRVLGNLQVYQALYPQYESMEIPLALTSSTAPSVLTMTADAVPMDPNLY